MPFGASPVGPLLLELFDVVQRQSHLLRNFGNQFITAVERHLELYVSGAIGEVQERGVATVSYTHLTLQTTPYV